MATDKGVTVSGESERLRAIYSSTTLMVVSREPPFSFRRSAGAVCLPDCPSVHWLNLELLGQLPFQTLKIRRTINGA